MIKVIMLDLDGTVYRGKNLILGADLAIQNMRECGVKVFFCTNNSTKTPESLARKLNDFNIPCTESDLISSGGLALQYVINHKLSNIYFSGSSEMRALFLENGILLSDEYHAKHTILAFDMEFTYDKLVSATRAAIISESIIVCNQDRLFPSDEGIYPGSGAIVTPVLYCSNRSADVFLGKPEIYMMDYVSKITRAKPNEILVIGDTLENDVAMAEKYGSKSILVNNLNNKPNTIKSLNDTLGWDWTKCEFH